MNPPYFRAGKGFGREHTDEWRGHRIRVRARRGTPDTPQTVSDIQGQSEPLQDSTYGMRIAWMKKSAVFYF